MPLVGDPIADPGTQTHHGPAAWPLPKAAAVLAGVLIAHWLVVLLLFDPGGDVAKLEGWLSGLFHLIPNQLKEFPTKQAALFFLAAQGLQIGVLTALMFVVVKRRYQEQYLFWVLLGWISFLPVIVMRAFDIVADRLPSEIFYNVSSAANDCLFLVAAASLYLQKRCGREYRLSGRAIVWLLFVSAGYLAFVIAIGWLGWFGDATRWIAAAAFCLLWFELYVFFGRIRAALPWGAYFFAAVFAAYAMLQWLYPFAAKDSANLTVLLFFALFLKSIYGLSFVLVSFSELQETSERRLAAAREASITFDRLLDETSTGYYKVQGKEDGTVVDCNEAMCRILGYASRDQLIGQEARALHFDADGESKLLASIDREDGGFLSQMRLRAQAGNLVVVDNQVGWDKEGGRVVGRRGLVRDITTDISRREQERLESLLDKALLDVSGTDNRTNLAEPIRVLDAVAFAIHGAIQAEAVAVIASCPADEGQVPGLSVCAIAGRPVDDFAPWSFLGDRLDGSRTLIWPEPDARVCPVVDSLAERFEAKRVVLVPILWPDGPLLGYLCAAWAHDDGFTKEHVGALEHVVPRLGGLVEHATSSCKAKALGLFALARKEQQPGAYLAAVMERFRGFVRVRGLAARVFEEERTVAEVGDESARGHLPSAAINTRAITGAWSGTLTSEAMGKGPPPSRLLLPLPDGRDGSLGTLLLEGRLVERADMCWPASFSSFDTDILEFAAAVVGNALDMLISEQGRNYWMDRIGHELSSSIHGIRSTADLLERSESRLSPALRVRLFRNIFMGCRTLRTIVDHQGMARRGAGQLRRVETRLYGDILRKTLEELKPLREMAGVKEAELIGDWTIIPPLYLDQERICKLFDNLIANAIKYTDRKRKHQFRVDLLFRADEFDFVVEVSNWGGIGIDANEAEWIFEEGYRSKAALAVDAKGMGLGLHIAREIARAHDGDIRLTALKDPTTFSVLFPRSLTHRPPSPPQEEADE
jgi:PAS domain S-box-containing protein